MSKFSLICFLLILPLLLSGCWSKRELNELAIVVALGVDKVDDEYELSIQVVILVKFLLGSHLLDELLSLPIMQQEKPFLKLFEK